MGILALGGKLAALGNAETMLLVRDHQTKIFKLGGIRQQRMGANRHLNLTGSDPLPDEALLLYCLGTGEQTNRNAQRFKQFI